LPLKKAQSDDDEVGCAHFESNFTFARPPPPRRRRVSFSLQQHGSFLIHLSAFVKF